MAKKLGSNTLLVSQPKSWGGGQSPPVPTVVAPMFTMRYYQIVNRWSVGVSRTYSKI